MKTRLLTGYVSVIVFFGACALAQGLSAPHGLGLAPDLHLPKEAPKLYDSCKAGDRAACTKFHALMKANRRYHDLWRRYRPEYFH